MPAVATPMTASTASHSFQEPSTCFVTAAICAAVRAAGAVESYSNGTRQSGHCTSRTSSGRLPQRGQRLLAKSAIRTLTNHNPPPPESKNGRKTILLPTR